MGLPREEIGVSWIRLDVFSYSQVYQSYWAEAINTATYIGNRCPTKSLNGRTPFEVWTDRKPNVSYFRERREEESSNHEPRQECSWDIQEQSIWLPDERKIEDSRGVKFLENSVGQLEILDELHLLETSDGQVAEYDHVPERAEENPRGEQLIRRPKGRPRIERTGAPGRPRKRYNKKMDVVETTCAEPSESTSVAISSPEANE